MRDLDELCAALDARLESELSPMRASHSRGVASLAAELCLRHGLDALAGRTAGLAHDLCKEAPLGEQRRLFDLYLSMRTTPLAWSEEVSGGVIADEILHGPAAAALLIQEYGLEDEAILEAVALHTVGDPDMGLLSVIVYCADKIEPGRKHVDDAFRRRCLSEEPRAMLLDVVEDSLAWLRKKGRTIAPPTLILYNALRNPVGPK